MTNKKVMILAIALLVTMSVVAQNSTNSPYTRFGYGKLVDAGFGRTNAMGGIGIGFRQKTTINPSNPASYSEIDSTSFLFELGFSGLMTKFSTNSYKSSKTTGNIDFVSMLFPISKKIGMSIGLLPYSFVGYNFSTKDSLLLPSTNDEVYRTNYQSFAGAGSISQVYFGLSYTIYKELSMGINCYYMFGSLKNIRYTEQTFSDKRKSYPTYSEAELRVNALNARLGLQYTKPLRQNKDILTVGAIYELKHQLGSKYNRITQGVDTVSEELTNVFELPNVYGLGVTYRFDNRLLIGLDAQMQQFSQAKFQNKTDFLKDRLKISLGAEYVRNPKANRYFDRMVWRLGGNFSNAYTSVNNRSFGNYNVSAGAGFPFKPIKGMLNISFEYGGYGTTKYDLIKEDYVKLGITFTLNEDWFYKRKVR
ncbi:MAG: hypothetical protein CSA89_00485 [Bacteroidales bacterium]|nr:MAG: hypothetical protein CSA89_00485 [Bacteroidales bacterium]